MRPNTRLKLAGAHKEGRIAFPRRPAFVSAVPSPCAGGDCAPQLKRDPLGRGHAHPQGRMTPRTFTILPVLVGVRVVLVPGALGAQAPQPSLATDTALVAHLRATDPFFGLFVQCKDVKVTRASVPAVHHRERTVEKHFTYRALCDVRGQEEDDCLYQVDLAGTIDTLQSATIRRLRWDLVCSG